MTKLFAVLFAGLITTSAFAASHAGAPMEAMKAGDPKAQATGQAKADAKGSAGDKSAMQPEAMKSGSAKAQGTAEARKSAKATGSKKNSTDAQMKKDAAKL